MKSRRKTKRNELDELDLDELKVLRDTNISGMVNAMRKAVVDENR